MHYFETKDSQGDGDEATHPLSTAPRSIDPRDKLEKSSNADNLILLSRQSPKLRRGMSQGRVLMHVRCIGLWLTSTYLCSGHTKMPDNLSPNSATVAIFGDSRRFRWQCGQVL